MDIALRIRQFVVENFYVTEPGTLADEASLLTLGVIDSTGVLEVIAFLESEFGIVVEDEDTTPENMESIARLAAFVQRKLTACPVEERMRAAS